MDINKQYPRRFLGKDDDLGDPGTVRKAYADIAALPVDTKEQADAWCDAWSEVQSAVSEVVSRAYFAYTRNTADKEAEAEYERLANEIIPLSEELEEKAKKRFVSLPEEWLRPGLIIPKKRAQMSLEIFREANLPLITENIRIRKEYQKISSEMVTEFDGKRMTKQQLRPYLEKQDRALRERAWRAMVGMSVAGYGKLNDLFDRALKTRKEMARNADLPDFTEYQYRKYERLSYDREDARRFRDAIKKYIVPAADRIFDRRREKLGLERLRPWDLQVDPDGANPPKIYENIDDLKDKVARVLGSVESQFADAFKLMDERGYLDLENRPAKAPGAYMNDFAEERISMIFSNFVGTSRDFDTLIHEGGHAMHGFLCRHLSFLERGVPLEFAEVASMSLELLARPYWDIVFGEEDRRRIGVKQLEHDLAFLPFMASLDEFQDWVYTHPDGESPGKRAECWRALDAKYRPHVDYTDLEIEQNTGWQYLHVYEIPLYYIEYGIAQVGAMQVFLRSLEDYDATVKDYLGALALGTTVGLPELYEAAGVKFVMKNPEVLETATKGIMEQIGLG
jgi:oligoendopeptidase F